MVRVLIDEIREYGINNNKLSREYVEAIAGHWKRSGIETVRGAMEICRKEHKKVSKTVVVTKNKKETTSLPDWFDKSFEKKSDNLDELEEVLKDFE